MVRGTGMESLAQHNKEEIANNWSFFTGMSLPSLDVFKQRLTGCWGIPNPGASQKGD